MRSLQRWRLVQNECAAVQIELCFAAILDRGQRCCYVAAFAATLLPYRLATGVRKAAAKLENGFSSRAMRAGNALSVN